MKSESELNEWNFVQVILDEVNRSGIAEFEIAPQTTNLITDLKVLDVDKNVYSIYGSEGLTAFGELLGKHGLIYEGDYKRNVLSFMKQS